MIDNVKEKWCWIELIGFDKECSDYAVGDFIKRFGETPSGISLLFMDLGFVLLHKSDEEYSLRPCDCVYGDKERNEERQRQAWTSKDLAELISSLHNYGVKVYISFFNILQEDVVDGIDFRSARETDKDGKHGNCISVIKHVGDGRAFSQVFLPRLRQVIQDYGFDGVQFADGTSCSRFPIELGDFSDDIVGRFVKSSNIKELNEITNSFEELSIRRDIILRKYRARFTVFLTELWSEYYAQIHKHLKGIPLIFNSFWTRDPFEAIYRYGIDYKKCVSKTDRVMIEEVSATHTILAEEDQCMIFRSENERKNYHYEFYLMQASIKCYMPTVEQITLTTIKDTTEQWDIIRQAPMELTKAVCRRNNGYVYDNGKLIKYSKGALYCLSDGVPEDNWKALSKIESVNIPYPTALCGATFLWSDDRLYGELESYIENRNYTANELYNELIRAGLTVSAMARADSLEYLNTPLIIANPKTLSKKEKMLINKCKAPIITLGYGELEGDFNYKYDIEDFSIRLYNTSGYSVQFQEFIDKIKNCNFNDCNINYEDEVFGIWVGKLKYKSLSSKFFTALSQLINKSFKLPFNDCPSKNCKITGFKNKNTLYLMLFNDDYYYIIPEIKIAQKIIGAKSIMKNDGYKVKFTENSFFDRIPPRSVDIVELQIQRENE